MKNCGINIIIDEITPCLKDNRNNTYVDTNYEIIKSISKVTARQMQKYEGWQFDWSDRELANCIIYALYVENSKVTQGLIACKEYKNRENVKGYIEVVLAEANPKNVGGNGIYKGIGAHLFALASKLSFDLGYEGYVMFMSKTDLVQHYSETLHAELLYERIMQLDTRASEYLVSVYDKKARDKHEEQ